MQNVPKSELYSIIKPCAFRGWTIDLIGQIYPHSSRGHKYIIVAIDCLTKWVKVIPLRYVIRKRHLILMKNI